MCGILGVITKNEKAHTVGRRTFLEQALYVDTLRGDDATGVISVTDDFSVRCLKGAVSGPKFLNYKGFHKMDTDGWAVIGHNRAATKGGLNKDNAHPFTHGDVSMVHNGTLHNMGRNLPHDLKDADVDSEVIAYNLSQEAPEDAAELLGKLRGAYALVWTDKRDQSINMARNRERPLHFGYTYGDTAMFFMSDGLILNMLCNRINTSIPSLNKMYKLGDGQLLKFKKGSLVPEVTKIVPFPLYQNHGNRANHQSTTKTNHGSRRGKRQSSGVTGIGAASKTLRRKIEESPQTAREYAYTIYQLTPEDRLRFEPLDWKSWYREGEHVVTGMVEGVIEHPMWGISIPAKLYGQTNVNYAMKKDCIWTVMPTGLTFVDSETDDAVIICHVTDYNNADQSAIEEDWEDVEDLVPGPDNKLISETEWYEKTKNGCGLCTQDLSLQDCDDIAWEGDNALCEKCFEVLTRP